MKKLFLLPIVMSSIYGNIVLVPTDSLTIQTAIYGAENGDTVIVLPGDYFENVRIEDKSIALGSYTLLTGDSSYVSNTVLHSDSVALNQSVVLNIVSCEVDIVGLTITDGGWGFGGGGLSIFNSNTSIRESKIINNTALSGFEIDGLCGYGGGVYAHLSTLTIENTVIADNWTDSDDWCESNGKGGGLYLDSSAVFVTGSIIRGNISNNGGGIYAYRSTLTIENSFIEENGADGGGGLVCDLTDLSMSSVTIRNNGSMGVGGGCHFISSDVYFDPDNRCNIYANQVVGSSIAFCAANDIWSVDIANLYVTLDTFSVGSPPWCDWAAPDSVYTFNILHDMNGNATSVNEDIKINYSILMASFPNPFNPSTTISYELPQQSEVILTIYDMRGREVRTLQKHEQSAGHYEIQWSGVDNSGNPVITGIYFAQLQAGDYSKTIKMVYLE